MGKLISKSGRVQIERLLQLTARIGGDPLLTQASTGNTSIKLDGVLWIKASGKWMADAAHEDILIPLDLAEVIREGIRRNLDPSERYAGASLETAMHAVLPHCVVLHVHSVNVIAWVVREDARDQLEQRLDGLRWRWIPYVTSGLPLARQIESALADRQDANVLLLGNHGLVVVADDCDAAEQLLVDVERRLAIRPRCAHPADYAMLAEVCEDSPWELPDDDDLHTLGTDPDSQRILSQGLLYPCQAVFSHSTSPELYRPVACPEPGEWWQGRYDERPFLIVQGRGVVVGKSMTPAGLAMIGGLAQAVQRIDPAAELRYLTTAEIAAGNSVIGYRYLELADARHGNGGRQPSLSGAGSSRS